MAEVRCKSTEGIFVLLFGGKQHDIWTKSWHDSQIDYVNNTYNGFRFVDMRQFNFLYYKRSIPNLHHIILACYIRIIYPYLRDLLGASFPYKRSDFDLYEYKEDDMDCSFLWPKKDMKWTVNIEGKVYAEHEGFECLTNLNKKYPGDKGSAYHRIFCASHTCCQIINESLPDGKSICVSGDSYMIPVIPVLACYYKEVVFLDNRDHGAGNESYEQYFEGKLFDNVLVACSESNPPVKYFVWNLK